MYSFRIRNLGKHLLFCVAAVLFSTAAAASDALVVCGQGCDHSKLKGAIAALNPGGTITIEPGRYTFCGVINKPLRLIGRKDAQGRRPHLDGGVCHRKAALVVRSGDVLISGLRISNVKVRHRNGACIRVDPVAGELRVDDFYCHDSQNGILAASRPGKLVITNSMFVRNGFGGRAHGLYINRTDQLILRRTSILSSKGQGHTLKTGARHTLVEDSVLAALDGRNSRAIDYYAGGELIVRRSVLQQGKRSDNHDIIGIGLEPDRRNSDPHRTVIEDNWIIYDDQDRCCRWLFNAKRLGPFQVRNNRFVGLTSVHKRSIDRQFKALNEFYADRSAAGLPVYDRTVASLPRPGWSPDR